MLQLGQSGISRALKSLRLVGVVASDSPRSAIRLRAPTELRQLLLAADRLAEATLALDATQQQVLSAGTRRAAIRGTRNDRTEASASDRSA